MQIFHRTPLLFVKFHDLKKYRETVAINCWCSGFPINFLLRYRVDRFSDLKSTSPIGSFGQTQNPIGISDNLHLMSFFHTSSLLIQLEAVTELMQGGSSPNLSSKSMIGRRI